MNYRLLAVVLCLLLTIPATLVAQSYDDDAPIKVNINPDFSASATWKLPNTLGLIGLETFSDYGSTGLMTYTLTRIANESKELFNSATMPYTSMPYTGGPLGGNNNVTYKLQTALQSPLAIYEIWIPSAGYYSLPKIEVSIPSGWQVVAAWPSGSQQNGTYTINYSEKSSYAFPVLLILKPNNIGSGNTLVKSGRFTIVGSSQSVQRLQNAISQMSYVDTVFQNTFGDPAPDSVIVYAADLSGASVGYEAEALAAKPNLILYNQDILSKQSPEEIQSVIIHEMTHIYEMELGLFRGGVYLAPWFKEGMAVLTETQARPYIYKDPSQLRAYDLLGRTRMFSAEELKLQYDNDFDLLFQGTFNTTVGDAYRSSGVVLNDYYQSYGAPGMKKLFAVLQTLSSSPIIITPERDSDVILNNMSKFTGIVGPAHLKPHKDSKSFESDVSKLVYPTYTDAELEQAARYAQQTIPKYFTSSPQAATASTSEQNEPSTSPPSRSDSSCNFTYNLQQGSRDSTTLTQVTLLQRFLVSKGHLRPEYVTGYYGSLTVRAVQDWQKASGIVSSGSPTTTGYGTIGPKSRAALTARCSGA